MLTTQIHHYSFNVSKTGDARKYEELCAALRKDRDRFKVLVDPSKSRNAPPEGKVELETDHLFDNQWNTVCGFRVFDWFECIFPNPDIKEGYWLEITPEMREIRRNTLKCGYCGHMEPAAKGYAFCPACLDSPYLKESDLHLTRLLPVESSFRGDRPPLTDTERAHILPQYIERQTTGADSRAAAKLREQRAGIVAKRDREVASAQTEASGLLWLLDRGVSIDNVIYYSHTDRFCFGWRAPVSDTVASKLLDIMSEFPHRYEIKGQTQTWSSE